MKCLIVFSLVVVGCALAQNFNDGRYYPEQFAGRYDDGKYRPDGSGLYRGQDDGKYRGGQGNRGGSGSGSGNRFGSGSGSGSGSGNRFGGGAPVKVIAAPAQVFAPVAPAKRFGGNSGASGDQIGIKEQTRELNEDGYFYRFVNENNIEVAESGRIENRGSDNEVLRAKGFYEYIGDDGVRYRVDYIADENGFQPTADHLPTPPPIPEEILRSLEALRQ
ncbi:pupal cuticle protein 36 [Culex quinquefasciatus]|uniref:pupal cuticle protein 36 n=1 Tax=Culex quinquefasciatus TaxID=7176 RepID=UPI0018E2CF28|nr:pupal cuticle protein 36 [Culex quinquefasciatus]